MEKEENLLHLLTEHSFLLFCVGAVLMFAIMFAIGVAVGKRNERKLRKEEKKGPN